MNEPSFRRVITTQIGILAVFAGGAVFGVELICRVVSDLALWISAAVVAGGLLLLGAVGVLE